MPVYEDETTTRDKLYELQRYHKCKECGGRLDVFYSPTEHKAFLACRDWPRQSPEGKHEGIEREASRYEKEGLASLNIATRRSIMEQTYGEEKTKALGKYMGPVAITREIAKEIVETLWGKAPAIEKTKCILLCLTYQLNPLLKHIYLIGYKRRVDGKVVVDRDGNPILDWSIQQGIGSTRLLAQRKHNFSYLDMTPRKATQAEIDKILGDTADKDCIYGFTHIKDVDTGAEAFGLRGIGKSEKIKGEEKGNTHLNMACIRSERLALDRQYPGEMPPNVEVVDERFIEGEYKVVDTETGEITESEPESTAPDEALTEAGLGVCPIHKIPLKAGKGPLPPYCPTKVDGTGRSKGTKVWCKGVLPPGEAPKTEAPAPAPEPEPEPEPQLEASGPLQPTEEQARAITGAELKEMDELMLKAGMDAFALGRFCNKDKGWGIESKSGLRKWQWDIIMGKLHRGLADEPPVE